MAIACFFMMAYAGPIPYISDRLLGKLAPHVIFLGGAYGTAAAGAVVGAALASGKMPHISSSHGGGFFLNDDGSQYVLAPIDHRI